MVQDGYLHGQKCFGSILAKSSAVVLVPVSSSCSIPFNAGAHARSSYRQPLGLENGESVMRHRSELITSAVCSHSLCPRGRDQCALAAYMGLGKVSVLVNGHFIRHAVSNRSLCRPRSKALCFRCCSH